ncbi:MAG: hypothetical protein J0651_02885, partial [Actinobacteria bacterium]|nr:hypothetical protein [Actinomycetota bacterium]
NTSLNFMNSTISNFRQGYGRLITLTSGYLTLQSSQLTNISTGGIPDTSAFASYSDRNAAILQNSSNSWGFFTEPVTYEVGAIVLDDVFVSLWNNGFEFSESLYQFGLLTVNGIRTIRISNCRFTQSIVQKNSFLSAINFLQFHLLNCSFSYMQVEYFLIKLLPAGLMTPGPSGELEAFTMQHVVIQGVNWTGVAVAAKDTAVPSSLIYVLNFALGINCRFEDLAFYGCTTNYIFNLWRFTMIYGLRDAVGANLRYTTLSGQRLTLYLPPPTWLLANISISSSTSGVNFLYTSSVALVTITNLSLVNSGDGLSSRNSYTFAHIVGKSGVYLTKVPGELSYSCTALLSIAGVYRLEVSNGDFRNSFCTKATAGLAFQVTGGTGSISLDNVKFTGVSGWGVGGGCGSGPIHHWISAT